MAPVEYIPAATGNSAATVSTPGLLNPLSSPGGGAKRSVMAIVIAPMKTSHVGSLSHAITANIATSRARVVQAWGDMANAKYTVASTGFAVTAGTGVCSAVRGIFLHTVTKITYETLQLS